MYLSSTFRQKPTITSVFARLFAPPVAMRVKHKGKKMAIDEAKRLNQELKRQKIKLFKK